PISTLSLPDALPISSSASGPSHRALSVLIIEDDGDSAASLSMILDFDGHHVRAAPDGAAGLRLLDEEPADVVLLDIGLPDMDGRSEEHTSELQSPCN